MPKIFKSGIPDHNVFEIKKLVNGINFDNDAYIVCIKLSSGKLHIFRCSNNKGLRETTKEIIKAMSKLMKVQKEMGDNS